MANRIPGFAFYYLDGRAANPFPKKSGAGGTRRRKKEIGCLDLVQAIDRLEQRLQVHRRFATPASR